MALEGSLKDFSVLDILQLVANQQKTGTLTIASKKGKIVVDFKKGMITGAFHVKKGEQLLIDEYLLESGRISEENLAKARKSHSETGMGWDEVLIRDGYIAEEEFKEIVTFKIQEIIDELFMWDEGTYRFELGKELYPYSRVKVSLRTQALIMEGARRVDELPRIRESLPDENVLVVKTGKVLPGLEPAEKKFLSLLSQPSTVAELIKKGRIGGFRTYEVLFNMIQAGIVKTVGMREPEVVRVEKPRRWQLKRIWGILLIFLVGAVAVVGLWMRKNLERGFGPISFDSYSRWTTESRLKTLENSLQVYFSIFGRFPESLQQLKEAGLATDEDVDRFEYVPDKTLSSYELRAFTNR
jgi:hypothetical protein